MTQNQNAGTAAVAKTDVVVEIKNRITSSVMNRIETMQKSGGIQIPKNYVVGNQINLAMLILSEMKTKDGRDTLSVATPASVANSLFRMCITGMSLEKKQCDFILYGDKLQFQLEYHGRIALAKRLGKVREPRATVIYEGDVFQYIIDTKTGNKIILKHEQDFKNIDNDKIVGAWAVLPIEGEEQPFIEVMNIAEIRSSWNQGAAKGASGAHRNFMQEMCKKTVISRACKLFISTSDDAGLYENMMAERDDKESTETTVPTDANTIDVEFEEMPHTQSAITVGQSRDTIPPITRPEPVVADTATVTPQQADAEESDPFNLD